MAQTKIQNADGTLEENESLLLQEQQQVITEEFDDDELEDNDEIDEDYDEDFIDDEEEDQAEDTTCPPTPTEPPKPKELTPFQKVIKTYLESECETDAELKAKVNLEDKAIVFCDEWITAYVREQFKGQSCGFIDDATGYRMMKEFFIDGVYENKLIEEEQKEREREERMKIEEEKRKKAEEKKRLEEEEKRRKEEEEKRWKEFLERPEEAKKKMTEDEILILKGRHATQGEFEF